MWAILVVYRDGESEYVKAGHRPTDAVATYRFKAKAEEDAASWRMGLDDVQSVNVVRWRPGGAG